MGQGLVELSLWAESLTYLELKAERMVVGLTISWEKYIGIWVG